MKTRFASVICGLILSLPAAHAADYYVSPSGSDSNPGTLSAPFASPAKAYQLATAGTNIYLRGGVYYPASKLIFNKAGTDSQPIRIFAYADERPIIDGTRESEQWRSLIEVSGSYNHLRGIEVRNASNMGVSIMGSGRGNILERLDVHRSGRVWDEGSGINIFESSSNNLILNCDAHHNYAPRVPGNADGIRSSSRGTGNILRGNRVYRNADDGFDMWNGAPTLLEGNLAFENGYDDNFRRLGDGNGFKLGGSHVSRGITSGGHTLRNNLAFRNPAHGFDENTADYPMIMHNNTAYNNGPDMPGGVSWTANFGLYKSGHLLRNNLNFGKLGTVNGDARNNSWNLPVTVNSSDFLSVAHAAAFNPRQADGSLPNFDFLRLTASSDLIDKGVNVGLNFSGAAPDLGAFEYSSASVPPPTVTEPAPAPAPSPSPSPVTAPPPTSANLALNPGFETKGAYWSIYGAASISSANVAGGYYSLKLGTGSGGAHQKIQGIAEGATYNLSVNGKLPRGKLDGCYIGFDYLDSANRRLARTAAEVTSGGWSTSTVRVSARSPAGAASIVIWAWKDSGVDSCYLDNFTLLRE